MAVVDIFITDKKYNVIYADPPWAYRQKQMNSNITMKRKNMRTA